MKQKVLIIIAIAALAIGGFLVGSWWQTREQEPSPVEESQPVVSVPEEGRTVQIDDLAEPVVKYPLDDDATFDLRRQHLQGMCAELDGRGYMQEFKLESGCYDHLSGLAEKLAYSQPVVDGETRDLYTLLKNSAHCYQVLGADNIRLVKEIVKYEDQEKLMAEAFAYLMTGMQTGRLNITMAHVYEYASFFLQTLSGTAYLARRDPLTRMLLTYYSVLIVDQASETGMNRHGVDIMPALENLQAELTLCPGLVWRERYQRSLSAIREKRAQ